MSRYIRDMISKGEGQQLDFKYCISDSRKIARTLSAFANCDGGTMLIGVRDNGAIAGIRDDEEIYMIETAAKLFCKPEIEFRIKQHTIDGKSILEIRVMKGSRRPYRAKDEDGDWKSYSRQGDKNILANSVLLEVWRREKHSKGVLIKFSDPESMIMEYLRSNGSITLSGFRKLAGISNSKARNILVNLILCNIVSMELSERGANFALKEEIKEP